MSLVYQTGNLTVISDPLDDLCDSVLIDFVEGYRKRQEDKWNILQIHMCLKKKNLLIGEM